jgi:putative ABC transport system substrate-binding protein
MAIHIRRREFILTLGGAAATWPLAARAQQATLPVIGYLNLGSPESDAFKLTGLRRVLNQTGYVEGRNLVIEYRWAGNQVDRLPTLAADLVQLQVTVIVEAGVVPALAAKAATTSTPIVFNVGADPVQLGLVASLNRPGGNLTGHNQWSEQSWICAAKPRKSVSRPFGWGLRMGSVSGTNRRTAAHGQCRRYQGNSRHG